MLFYQQPAETKKVELDQNNSDTQGSVQVELCMLLCFIREGSIVQWLS